MGYWSVVLPEATENLITNPSFEVSNSGWITWGTGTIARSSDIAIFGNHSAKCTYQDTTDLGVYTITFPAAGSYYFTAYVYLPSDFNSSVKLDISGLTGSTITQATTTTDVKNKWIRLTMGFDVVAGDLAGFILLRCVSTPTAGKYCYLDGVQLEAKVLYPTTYCDGDQPGCKWTGAWQLSKSTRTANTFEGGRSYELSSLGLTVEEIQGAGMPQIQHLALDRIMLDGQEYQRSQVKQRYFRIRSTVSGSTMTSYHSTRRTIIESLARPDDRDRSYILQYTGADSDTGALPKEIRVRYDRGMELSGPTGFSEIAFWVQLVAYEDPYFKHQGANSLVLDAGDTINSHGILSRIDGHWGKTGTTNNVGAGDFNVYAVAVDKASGYLYIGGTFTGFCGTANLNYIAKYNLATGAWGPVEYVGEMNGAVHAIVPDGKGNIYVGGKFTNGGGEANADYFAVWTGSDWQPVGQPLQGAASITGVYAIAIDRDGYIYVGGDFVNWADIASADYIAQWLPAPTSGWYSIATPPSTGDVEDILITPDNILYCCGNFTNMNAIAEADKIARFDIDNASWSALHSTPHTAEMRAMTRAANGDIIISGGDNTWNSITGNGLWRWNGQTFLALGGGPTGTNKTVHHTLYDEKGRLWALGQFDDMGGIHYLADGAIWTGANWVPCEPYPYDMDGFFHGHLRDNGDLFLGHQGQQSGYAIQCPGTNTITNAGTAKAYPIITIERTDADITDSVFLRSIRNNTTGAELFFERRIQTGEKIVIDLTPGVIKCTSTIPYPYEFWPFMPGSEISSFYLAPGDNDIQMNCWVDGGPTFTTYITWRTTDWSID